MDFDKVIGQQNLLHELKKMVDTDRLPHALFLKGNSGYGPLPIALSLSAYLLTPESERSDLSTSKQHAKASKFLHPDLNFALPVVKKDPKRRDQTTSSDFLTEWRETLGQNSYIKVSDWLISISKTSSNGDINVAECNQIINNMGLKPFESDHKVQIIWMPQYLGNNGNRLLKLIEEPPPNTYFFFVGDSTEYVLNTIISRCQIVNVPRITDEAIEAHLVKNHDLDASAAQRISFLADGDYNAAVSMLSIDSTVSLEYILGWISVCSSANAAHIRDWVNGFNDLSKEERKGTLLYFLKVLRELIHMRIVGEQIIKLGEEESKLVQNDVILNKLTIGHIGEISDVVNNIYVLLERNANPRILLFQSSLQIGIIIKKSTLVEA